MVLNVLSSSFCQVPCPLIETFKRLVKKKSEPCKQHKLSQKPKDNQQTKINQQPEVNKLIKTNQTKNGSLRHKYQCRCHGEQHPDQRLRLEIFIPEKYFSPPESSRRCKATKVHDGRGGPVKDAVKKAVSDMQSRISEESQGRSPSGLDRAYDRNRKCVCLSGNKTSTLQSKSEPKSFVCDRTSASCDTKPSRTEKMPLIIEDFTDDDYYNASEFEETHTSESELENKLKGLAIEYPSNSSWHSAESSAKPNDGFLTETSEEEGDYAYLQTEAASLPQAEQVQSVTDYEDEDEKEVEPDETQEIVKSETSEAESQDTPATLSEIQPSSDDNAADAEESVADDAGDNASESAGDDAGDNASANAADSAADTASVGAGLKVEVPDDVVNIDDNGADETANNADQDAGMNADVTVNTTDNTDSNAGPNAGLTVNAGGMAGQSVAEGATNALIRVYSSASNVVKTVTSNVEVNKEMLMSIIALLLFVIGMLLLYLFSRKCVYKKPRIYRGNCHFLR